MENHAVRREGRPAIHERREVLVGRGGVLPKADRREGGSMSDEEKVIADPSNREELVEWLDIIHDQVYDLVMNRFMFKSVWRVIEESEELKKRPSHFYGWFRSLYAQAMAMAIRR